MKTTKSLFGILIITTALAVQVQAQTFLTNGLVAYYPFNGNANDASGHGSNATVSSVSLTTDRFGVSNSAYGFTGNKPERIQATLTDDPRTFSAWVLSNPFTHATAGLPVTSPVEGDDRYIFGIGQNSHRQFGLRGDISAACPTGFAYILCEYTTAQEGYQMEPGLDADNPGDFLFRIDGKQWVHVVATVGDSVITVFVNGKVAGTINYQTRSPIASGTTLCIGDFADAISGRVWNGSIDDVRIYNRALSDSEVQQLYAIESTPPPGFETNGLVAYYPFNGNANDASGNGHDGTNINATLATDRFGVPNQCYDFNGTNSHVDIGASIQLGKPHDAMTISAWFFLRNSFNPQFGPDVTIVTDYSGPDGHVTGDYHFFADLQFAFAGSGSGSATNLMLFWSRSTPAPDNHNWGNRVIDLSGWHSCVAVMDGQATTRIYIDGMLDSEAAYDSTLNYLSNPFWRIGASLWNNQLDTVANGFIDDVRIYNRALSDSEVQQLYAYESVPPCIPHTATATATIVNGLVVGATITDGGCGYTNTPAILFQGGGGTGATATAVVSNGVVVGISINDAGSGYSNTPTVYFYSPLGLQVGLIKAVKPSFANLSPGFSYQLQFSTDMNTWTNQGSPFTATAPTMVYPQYFDVDNWGSLFFRLQTAP